MRVLISALAALGLFACSPQAPPEPPADQTRVDPSATPSSSAVEFQIDAGNVGCIYTPAGGTDVYQTPDGAAELKCDRVEPSYARVVLPQNGPAALVETQERGCCAGETLAAGRWTAGPFQCDVGAAELSCVSAGGHGFSLDRGRIDTH